MEGNMVAIIVILLSLLLHYTQQQDSYEESEEYDEYNPVFPPLLPALSEYEKKCADDPTTDRRCGCDPECAKYGDCCPDSIYFKAEEQKLGASTASCYTEFFVHFYVTTRCPSTWEDPQTRYLCEHPDPTYPNPVFDTLVTSLRTNVTYRNSYCASCYDDLHNDIFTWPLEVSCEFEPSSVQKIDALESFQRMFYDRSTLTWYFDLSGLKVAHCVPCAISLINASYIVNCPSPHPVVFANGTKTHCTLRPKLDILMSLERRLRYCEDAISWCASDWDNTTERELCEAYNAHVYACRMTYRNYHCALCNYKAYDAQCDFHSTEYEGAHDPPLFSRLPGISGFGCFNNGFYDSLSHRCVDILRHQRGTGKKDASCVNVSFTKEEYFLAEENSSVFLPSLKATYYQDEFYIQNDLVFVCLPAKPEIQFSPQLGYFTTAGLSLSIICILLHLTVLCLGPKKLNLPAMNLASLCVSLLLLYSSSIASGSVGPKSTSCVVVAVVIHYGLIASFFWMLIISLDIFNMTRQIQTKLVALRGEQIGRFMIYSTIGWLTPTIIPGSAVLLDLLIPVSSFAPAYGNHRCWLNHFNAILLFCLAPLISIMSLNVIFFIRTSHLIHQMRHSMKTPATQTNFRLSTRLFIIMGLTWMTGIFAAAVDAEVLWYLFVVLNTTQSAFIFIAFSCKKEIRQELQSVFKKSTNVKTRSVPPRFDITNTE